MRFALIGRQMLFVTTGFVVAVLLGSKLCVTILALVVLLLPLRPVAVLALVVEQF